MKKIILLFLVLLFSVNIYTQETYRYDTNIFVDSMLITVGNQIEQDLASDGFSIKKQKSYNILLVGSCMILEVFFTPKCSYILTMFGTTKKTYDNYYKQVKWFQFLKRSFVDTMYGNIGKYNKLLLIQSFTYKFISVYNDSPPDHAIYGEYKFSINDEEQYDIVYKRIEVLKSKEEIIEKHRLIF